METVPYLDRPLPLLELCREWVSLNKPCRIQNAISHWPALTLAYLREVVGANVVSVTVAPYGYADAVLQDHFIMPEERQLPFMDFLDIVEKKVTSPNIFYVQKQCSSLTKEFPELVWDVRPNIPWMIHTGDFENLYCVISGKKHFLLHPPTDRPFILYGKKPGS